MARLSGRRDRADDVSWGLATWVAPFVPLVAFVLVLPLAWVVDVHPLPEALVLGGSSALLAVVGGLLLLTGGARRRGLGWGLLAGGVMALVGYLLGTLAW